MDGDFRRGAVPADLAIAETRGVPVRSGQHGRDPGSGSDVTLQDLFALSGPLVGMGRHA